MAKRPNNRLIQLPDEVVLALIKQGLEMGFKSFKPYAEFILTEQSKRPITHISDTQFKNQY